MAHRQRRRYRAEGLCGQIARRKSHHRDTEAQRGKTYRSAAFQKFWVPITRSPDHPISIPLVQLVPERRKAHGHETGSPSALAAYGQMQWNAPAGKQPGGQGMNELA